MTEFWMTVRRRDDGSIEAEAHYDCAEASQRARAGECSDAGYICTAYRSNEILSELACLNAVQIRSNSQEYLRETG